jgi:geranylgeranyl reductase family protein
MGDVLVTTDYDVIIVGGGPAGCAAAIRLAESGARVVVLEEKHHPRGKLCGEFITPESFPTLRRLGVLDRMTREGARQITDINLVAASGKIVSVPISDMSDETAAMSLSRARFDQILFERARERGAVCREGIAVKECIFKDGQPCGVEALSLADGEAVRFRARIVIDASGRNSRLTLRRGERLGGRPGARLYALKAHLRSVAGIDRQVELYFFRGGYGGLSRVEEGLVNLCFITSEAVLRQSSGDPSKVLLQTVMKNPLARERLAGAEVVDKWFSTGPLTFGTRRLARSGALAIGDASGMIDPFTGTGIQMALRTGDLAAESVVEALGREGNGAGDTKALVNRALRSYAERYESEFGKRMRVAQTLRNAAFSPVVANSLAALLSRAPWLARRVLKATRT